MRARWRIIVVLVALVLVSGYAGGLIGARIQRQKAWRRSHPEAANMAAAVAEMVLREPIR